MAEIELDQKAMEAGWWHYKINYGPNGEENYANVYDASGELVSNLKIHHAREIVGSMNDIRLAALRPVSDEAVTEEMIDAYKGAYDAHMQSILTGSDTIQGGTNALTRDATRAGLRAALAHTGKPTVRALEWWSDDFEPQYFLRASTPFGSYALWISGDLYWWAHGDSQRQSTKTETEAKAAAQADYEQRILSALQTGGET